MTHDETLIVSGFGRCGSSVVMQMLAVGGMKCAGHWPSYEPDELLGCHERPINPEFVRRCQGGALKVLDPHLCKLPQGNYRVIWLDRDPIQQAKSQIKFMSFVGGMRIASNRDNVERLAASYAKDRPLALEVLRTAGCYATLYLRFEDLLQSPSSTALKIADFAGLKDAGRMAGAIRPRPTLCAPDLLMELTLIEEGKPVTVVEVTP